MLGTVKEFTKQSWPVIKEIKEPVAPGPMQLGLGTTPLSIPSVVLPVTGSHESCAAC